ncbi:MAG: sigma 54-interacting transcriptional regulator [Candidatus Scalindua sp.]|nr:sigma 54-interacting transcriptional regulator [Candidatus Scalindua sp.]
MKKEEYNHEKFSELRQIAERKLKSKTNLKGDLLNADVLKMSNEDACRLAYELQVHQIELEMQNEELRKAQGDLESSRDKYTFLYDHAPAGYFTINEKGLIQEANLTGAVMLGTEQRQLIAQPFSKFIARADQDKYYLLRNHLFKNTKNMVCDLVMIRRDSTQFHARIDCTVKYDEMRCSRQCMAMVTDITRQKQAEDKIKAAFLESLNHKQNLDAIFKSMRDGIILLDSEQRIAEFNDSARRICGLPDIKKARGRRFETLIKSCGGECLQAVTETLKTKLPAHRDRFECSRCLVSITTNPILDTRGQFAGCTLVVKDETRLAILEDNLLERQRLQNIVGKSGGMHKIFSLIEALSGTSTTVLITGENGTGKGLVAEALHYYEKGGQNKPFVVVSCSSLSENVLESELFGHVKGSFTGAVSDRVGRFQKADGGTIFLDEIGDISHTMQLRLLRILEEKIFERVGDSVPIKVDVRIIAATNQDLRRKVTQGKFREDLYHRLKVVEITMPPLRDRSEDIPLLIEYFIKKLNIRLHKNIESVSATVLKRFMDYRWPGNIRQLYNTMEYAFVTCTKSCITIENLPSDFDNVRNRDRQAKETANLKDRNQIVKALEKSGWNKAKAARMLGVHRVTIYKLMKKHSIKE